MQQNNKKRICRVCGKPLQIEKCPECQGTGEVSHFFFWEKECPTCKGSGTRFRCPDEYNQDHIIAGLGIHRSRLPLGRQWKYAPLSKEKIAPSSKQRCPTCNGTGQITYCGMMAPCSTCRPIEFGEWLKRSIPPPGYRY